MSSEMPPSKPFKTQAAAEMLADAAQRMARLVGNGCLFEGHCFRKGTRIFSVQFFWPGILRLHEDDEIKDFQAAEMLQGESKNAATFMDIRQGRRPLMQLVFEHKKRVLRAVFSVDGVLKILCNKTRNVLAVSEPGRPEVLAPRIFRD